MRKTSQTALIRHRTLSQRTGELKPADGLVRALTCRGQHQRLAGVVGGAGRRGGGGRRGRRLQVGEAVGPEALDEAPLRLGFLRLHAARVARVQHRLEDAAARVDEPGRRPDVVRLFFIILHFKLFLVTF